ncbi:MarR family winged helix-turn-helix transcriptional regulator [Pseudooceanicola nanhaiensis]|uniref:MarR family winged helix-turn-helix transcriptional regulator n=1 Tax=Pseudooceanicola nanhaiensis TaxID=375761 RepID=UPI001CD1EFEB|nr:MarR family transcriptional regulator [Pseudooceanicola nanhaiensis]MCA0920110.1 winged helix DNA-binding protein [Pseudooceanicola nanhaiensis]
MTDPHSPLPPYRLHESLGYRLSMASRIQERRFDDMLRTIGLTRLTWCLLLGVANEELTQPSDLADFVGIDRTATSRALRQLEGKGLLARVTGEDDRRTRQVSLTQAGRDAVAQGTPFARLNAQAMSDCLSPEEEAELKRLLGLLSRDEDRTLPGL